MNANMVSKRESQLQKINRKLRQNDIPVLMEKIFSQFDVDKNKHFSKSEFSKVIQSLVEMVGGDCVHQDDVEDIFNLLDVNGDETVDRQQFQVILAVFFKVLKEHGIDIEISRETDMIQ